MKGWIAALLFPLSTVLFVASGCGDASVTTRPDVNAGGASSGNTGGTSGASASGGTHNVIVGEGGATSNGCPSSCDELNADCGYVTDTKCGGVVQCGDCPAGQTCGANGPSLCGDGTAGTSGTGGMMDCTPSTCDELNANCGSTTDTKCGGVVDCGKCPDGQTCGFGGPNQCGDNSGGGGCVVDPATTCDGRGATCGHVADNCGNDLDCGPTKCPVAGQSCIQNVCNTATCVVDPATTCAGRGFTCGQAADNCGHLLDCGPTTCDIPGWTCGGGADDNGDPILGVCGCTGECSKVPSCSTGKTTSLKGKVYDPAGNNPLYRVLVYIANDPSDPALKSFPKGLTCDVCGASAAGSPLVSTPGSSDPPAGTYTGVDGSFELDNVPVDKNVTLVIQLGRWRRLFKVDIDKACDENDVPDGTLRMPSTQADGNIPLMAMVTGDADSLECVLRKMGIDGSEFTDPGSTATDVGTGAGRIQFYLGDGDGGGDSGQKIDGATPDQSALFQTGANGDPVLDEYDMAILACQGKAYPETDANQSALRDYAASGGRVFATHYSYTWLYQNDADSKAASGTADNWSEVAQWHDDGNDTPDTATGIIDKVSNPKGDAFQGWLEAVNASAKGSGTVDVVVVRHDTDSISSVTGQTQQWLYRNGTNLKTCSVTGGTCKSDSDCSAEACTYSAQTCTSNSDCAARVCSGHPTTTCTRNSDCRNAGPNYGNCSNNTCDSNTCTGNDYTNDEIPLHFTFNTPVNLTQDLTATPPVVQCGRVLFSDFHVQDAQEHGKTFPAQCGAACSADSDCTGKCSNGTCPWGSACSTDKDCPSSCSDGYCLDPMNPQEKLLEYMIFDLGSCVPPPKACEPATKCPAGQDCGYAPDGCNGLIPCGTCPDGELCGVGDPAVPNHCGSTSCTPDTDCPADQECGFASDGCNGVISCGTCPAGETCNDGKCGSGSCDPKSCAQQGIECGQAGDACGNQIQCPACPSGELCISGKCVPQGCAPQSCADQNIECGSAADGCGNKIDSCGVCSAGSLCLNGTCVPIR